MDSDSMVQKKLDFVRSNLLRVPQPGDAEELPGYVIMQRNYRVCYNAEELPGYVMRF